MNFIRIIPLFLFVILGFHQIWAQSFKEDDYRRGSYHAQRKCYDLTHYRLQLKIDPVTRFISGSNRLSFYTMEEMKTLQIDLDPGFEIEKIISPLGTVRWSRIGSAVLVNLPTWIKKWQNSWIQVHYAGHPHIATNPPWDGGFVWHQDSEGQPWVGVSCEGQGSSLWFPSKDHPQDEPDSALLQFEVPKNLVAVSNGQFVEKKSITDSTVQFTYRVTYPINHYNISLNVAQYVSWSDTMKLPESGAILKMNFHVLPGFEEKARNQFKQAKTVIRVLSQLFGDYPFVRDGYQLIHTPYLGMEHQSGIAYGSKFQNNSYGFDFILMHETGHEWWGNFISASDHASLWIHESFCTYSEALFVEKTADLETAYRYLLEQKKKIKNKSPMQGPIGVYYNGWKDSDIYYKGTWMLHSLRYVVDNDLLWFSFLKNCGSDFKFIPISTDGFVENLSFFLKMDLDLKPFFNQYLNHTDWPLLELKRENREGSNHLAFRWNCAEKEFEYPVEILIDSKPHRINPGKEWKSIPVENLASTVELNEKKFLAKMQWVKN